MLAVKMETPTRGDDHRVRLEPAQAADGVDDDADHPTEPDDHTPEEAGYGYGV